MHLIRKSFIVGLTLLLCGCATPRQQIQPTEIPQTITPATSSPGTIKDLSGLVKKITPSVVVINVFDNENKLMTTGTGFFVAKDGALVTNYHVIEGAVKVEARLSSGEVLPIEGVLSKDIDGDLVLLTLGVKQRFFPPLKLADAMIEAGNPVVVIGNPLGLEKTVSNGIVSAVREIPEFGKILQITAPISIGSSGSPVLNMKGEVVGAATLYIKEGQSLNCAIPFQRVASLLSQP
jgi:S1-C subfamily serine protease